jgi:hypothetical protein
VSRDGQIAAFLARNGLALADARPLAQDASFRRYLRLPGAVLMDAPPPEDVRPFLRMAEHLRGIGMAVPAVFASDPEIGLVLEEDFGDSLLSDLMDRGEPATPLLAAAVDALVVLQRAKPPVDAPLWDAALMASTAIGTLCDWWWPARYGTPAPDGARRDIAAGLAEMLEPVAAGPVCLVHRDFFAGNLLRLPDGRIGVIDFQGAAIGHPAYDLVSLLQDARRDIPGQDAALGHYLRARPELDPVAFRAAYDACAAQRHLRVACQWVRLALRDARPQYLAHGPRTWAMLAAALRRPAAAPLARVLDRWLPAADRANPPGLAA